MFGLASSALMLALLVFQAPVAAQSPAAQTTASITATDIQRLRQALADATSEVDRVKTRDAATSSR